MLQKAGLSDEADPENNLGGSSETMYFIGLDVHKKTSLFFMPRICAVTCSISFIPERVVSLLVLKPSSLVKHLHFTQNP